MASHLVTGAQETSIGRHHAVPAAGALRHQPRQLAAQARADACRGRGRHHRSSVQNPEISLVIDNPSMIYTLII